VLDDSDCSHGGLPRLRSDGGTVLSMGA
jgi:hypothetical protein